MVSPKHLHSAPATTATFAAYLLAVAPGLSRGTLGRRRAAIGTSHRQSGQPIPLLDAATQAALRATARPKTARRSASPTSAGLQRLANKCPRDLPGLRDRALLLLVAELTRGRRFKGETGAAMANGATGEGIPRLFLLRLDAEHVLFTARGMALQVRARADDAEPNREVLLTRSVTADTCPVRALEDWLRASDTAFGPVFRKVDRWGNVEHGRLHADAWARIVARRSGDPADLGSAADVTSRSSDGLGGGVITTPFGSYAYSLHGGVQNSTAELSGTVTVTSYTEANPSGAPLTFTPLNAGQPDGLGGLGTELSRVSGSEGVWEFGQGGFREADELPPTPSLSYIADFDSFDGAEPTRC